MGDYEGKARDLVKKAEKKLQGGFLGNLLGNKKEEAAELLEKAANNFKLAKAWQEAGDTFVRLADVYLKLDSKHEAATAYTEAAKSYTKVNPQEAIKSLQRTIGLYQDMGRLGMAARSLRDMAESEEKQGRKEQAMDYYKQAAELYAGEESSAEANKCRLKVAQFAAEVDQYRVAIQIYEDVARQAVDNNLLKFSAKGYLMNAGLCQLCVGDPVAIQSAIERYEDIDINFSGSRECTFMKDIAAAMEEGDVQKFTDTVQEFDSLTRLDAWKTGLLLKVKKGIENVDVDLDLT